MRNAILTILLVVPAFAFWEKDDFKISTDVSNVILDVSVRDAKGGYVSGLPKEAFHVEEDGIPQTVSFFTDVDVPVTVGLIMDDSASMRPKRADVITAGLVFAGASNPKDEMFVINFNDEVRFGLPPAMPFSGNVKMLSAALSKDQPAGRTVLYDALVSGLEHLQKGTRDRKTLVLVSDGGDTASQTKLPEMMRMVEESHATVYTVGLLDPDDQYNRPRLLKHIAAVSGGEAFMPQHLEDVIPICAGIAKDIRNRYTIGYVPQTGKSGMHKIRISAMDPNHGRLVVTSRTSYLDPARQ